MYPTIEDVQKADQLQLCRWLRFLQSPGLSAIGRSDFYSVMDHEAAILNRIMERSIEGGGFTPQISKAIGWEG